MDRPQHPRSRQDADRTLCLVDGDGGLPLEPRATATSQEVSFALRVCGPASPGCGACVQLFCRCQYGFITVAGGNAILDPSATWPPSFVLSNFGFQFVPTQS